MGDLYAGKRVSRGHGSLRVARNFSTRPVIVELFDESFAFEATLNLGPGMRLTHLQGDTA